MKKRVREWKEFLLPYQQAVDELKVKFKAIRKEYRAMSKYSPIEFVTGRVKKISSIIEKCERRNIDIDDIQEVMEDIAGIRIMCQFKDDIYNVVDLIHERSGKDLEILYEKDYISNPKQSGYKSYHIIIKYSVQTAFGEENILAELQIRTLAMNFWATIEHSLNYKYKEDIPPEVKEKLVNAAKAVTLLDDEVCGIRNEIINAQQIFELKSNIVSDITKNLKRLDKYCTPEKVRKYYDEFDEAWESEDEEKLKEFLVKIKGEIPLYTMDKEGE
ncbi:GTP pyrophosphokinase family protein [Clostridiaceae bacterium HSG29]|nr:GTP pyrophosphokinase family protein [Clostridiaceae bacterium HSG29]